MDPAETRLLRQQIERSLRGAFDPSDVLPRLARLARVAEASSDDAIFANQKLAELLAERDPWRAALFVRRALVRRTNDDRAWAILAFCHTMLGNFRCAANAYEKAIACAPDNPWYAHNLGHLFDVALGDAARAVSWLEVAYQAKSDNSEIVASYAHALARSGQLEKARSVIERARERLDSRESRELEAVLRWLDQGAPSKARRDGEPPRARRSGPTPRHLARLLERGLSHLPLDREQRLRALALARDALPSARPPPPPPSGRDLASASSKEGRASDLAGLAAAVAYAIVYVDHLPLSQAEVAAPFRVGVADLRGRFAELRAKLDIVRGDTRYATTRR